MLLACLDTYTHIYTHTYTHKYTHTHTQNTHTHTNRVSDSAAALGTSSTNTAADDTSVEVLRAPLVHAEQELQQLQRRLHQVCMRVCECMRVCACMRVCERKGGGGGEVRGDNHKPLLTQRTQPTLTQPQSHKVETAKARAEQRLANIVPDTPTAPVSPPTPTPTAPVSPPAPPPAPPPAAAIPLLSSPAPPPAAAAAPVVVPHVLDISGVWVKDEELSDTRMALCVCVYMCVYVCVYACVCACLCLCVMLHAHTLPIDTLPTHHPPTTHTLPTHRCIRRRP